MPEVETVRRTIAARDTGRRIEAVEVRRPKFVEPLTPEEFAQRVTGRRIAEVDRQGKYLILRLTEGGAKAASAGAKEKAKPAGEIIIHLKMAGRLLACRVGDVLEPKLEKHTHVVFQLEGDEELRHIDLRHFGRVSYVAGARDRAAYAAHPKLKGLAALGPEPLSPDLTEDYLKAGLARRKTKLKPLLLDQSFIAGLGNIYADECLYRARIHPERRANELKPREVRALFEAIQGIIAEAIAHRGTTIATYVDGEGRRGEFAAMLLAYGRTGEECSRCGTPIERIVLGGRSTHFCPKCQKLPGAKKRVPAGKKVARTTVRRGQKVVQ
ncbi:MAG: bifunctional DNA-formamidopyrimidine glycosylase/DNA-(apurinic or apyrimidinic site) lyase [Bacillota bacterium]